MKLSASAKFFGINYLIWSSLLFLTSNCETSKGIGFDLVPQSEVGVFFTDTISVEASSVLGDSLVTTSASNLLFGQYTDPVLGKVKAKSFFTIVPFTDRILLDQNKEREITLDSLVLRFTYTYNYADINKSQRVSLHRLTGTLYDTVRYINSSEIAYDPTPLTTLNLKGSDLGITTAVTINLSTLPNASELVNEIFTLAKDSATREELLDVLKGFALIPDEGDDAAILGFAGTPSLGIFYTKKTPVEGSPDKLEQLSSFLTTGQRFNNVQSERSGTALAGLTSLQPKSATLTNDIAFLQSGVNIYTEIRFPFLDKLKELGSVAINRAELTIKPVIASMDFYVQPPALVLYETDDSHRILTRKVNNTTVPLIILPEEQRFSNSPSSLITYDTRNEEYVVNISSQLQGIFTDRITNQGILIAPANAASSVNRLLLNNKKDFPYSIKLRVFYTVFK